VAPGSFSLSLPSCMLPFMDALHLASISVVVTISQTLRVTKPITDLASWGYLYIGIIRNMPVGTKKTKKRYGTVPQKFLLHEKKVVDKTLLKNRYPVVTVGTYGTIVPSILNLTGNNVLRLYITYGYRTFLLL
jgi:hypothetical protein